MSSVQVSPVQLASHIVDINPNFGRPGEPMLLHGVMAIRVALITLLSSHVGVRSKTFQQFYGSGAFDIFEEPIDDLTAVQLRAALFACIERFEPRVALNFGDCIVMAKPSISGYAVTLSYSLRSSGETDSFSFNLI